MDEPSINFSAHPIVFHRNQISYVQAAAPWSGTPVVQDSDRSGEPAPHESQQTKIHSFTSPRVKFPGSFCRCCATVQCEQKPGSPLGAPASRRQQSPENRRFYQSNPMQIIKVRFLKSLAAETEALPGKPEVLGEGSRGAIRFFELPKFAKCSLKPS
jgi:hypothetical protein